MRYWMWRRYDVFKLSDAMMAGDTARYTRVLEELQGEGTALPFIVITLAGQSALLITIRKGLDSGQTAHATDEPDPSMGRSTESDGKRRSSRLDLKQLIATLVACRENRQDQQGRCAGRSLG